jgi:hypothetical protein
MTNFKIGDMIQCNAHPEWGVWGVSRDCGEWWEIRGRGGDRVLFKSEPGWRAA